VGLAYIRHPDGGVLTADMVRAGEYQVNVGGRLYPAAVGLRPPFDPAGDRVKGRYESHLFGTNGGSCPGNRRGVRAAGAGRRRWAPRPGGGPGS